MSTNFKHIIVLLMLISIKGAFAQTGSSNWSFALKSSYFGDQSHDSHNVTTIDNPLSVGFQLRYFARTGMALQLTSESMNGDTKDTQSDELTIHSSLSALFYPVISRYASPYFIYGLNLVQSKNGKDSKTSNDLNWQMGVGSDFYLIGNIVYSANAKIYSDGWNYLGWGTSFSIGYRF